MYKDTEIISPDKVSQKLNSKKIWETLFFSIFVD